MGTFLGYYGNPAIREDKRQEFTEHVLKILDQGGMMDVETVSIFGRNVDLLQPPGVDDNGNVLFCCNFFENFVWETGLYRPATAQLHTNKVGTRQFNLVSRALYVLNEFYAETFGIAEEDGRIYDAGRRTKTGRDQSGILAPVHIYWRLFINRLVAGGPSEQVIVRGTDVIFQRVGRSNGQR